MIVTLEQLGLTTDDLTAIGKLSESGMTPDQIASNIKYGVKDFINLDVASMPIKSSESRVNWVKGLVTENGIIAIELKNLYNVSAIVAMLNIQILESDATKKAKEINVSGAWVNNAWTYGHADDLNSNEELKIRFAKNTTTQAVYLLLGELAPVWTNAIVKISIPIASNNSIDFTITKLSSLTNIVTDVEKKISVKVDAATLGTLAEFTANLN